MEKSKMPVSTLTKNQFITFGPVEYQKNEETYRVTAIVRYDDRCGNGHNTFSITGSIDRKGKYDLWVEDSSGCIHEEISMHFPELAPLIKWHLTSSDGPLHYTANALYLASTKDCWGLEKGEKRQIKNGKTGLPAWHLVAIDENGNEVELYALNKSLDAAEAPACPYRLEYRAWCRIGEGKESDLDGARRAAVWPEATLQDFTQEKLDARLPDLMREFRAAVESLGFKY